MPNEPFSCEWTHTLRSRLLRYYTNYAPPRKSIAQEMPRGILKQVRECEESLHFDNEQVLPDLRIADIILEAVDLVGVLGVPRPHAVNRVPRSAQSVAQLVRTATPTRSHTANRALLVLVVVVVVVVLVGAST
jgi:hypothetical protein